MHIVILLILAGLAGWLAARLVRGERLGLWGNMGVGVVGAVLGGLLLGRMGVQLIGPLGQFVTALLGAVILLWAARLLARRR